MSDALLCRHKRHKYSHGFARQWGVNIKESSEAQNVEPVHYVIICMGGVFLTATVWEETVAVLLGDCIQ